MKVLLAAIVAAVVASGSTAAATSYVNGRSIRPHSIPLNRLVRLPEQPQPGFDIGYICVHQDDTLTWSNGAWEGGTSTCQPGERLLRVAMLAPPS